MSRQLDDDQRFREERAEQLRERDREREPRSFRRPRRDLAARDALRLTLVERGAAQEPPASDRTERDADLCSQCRSNARSNDAGGYHRLAEECRAYCRSGHDPAALTTPAPEPEP